MNNALTEHGIRAVKTALNIAENSVNDAKTDLIDAERHYEYMKKVASCEHELEASSGVLAVVIQCKKCRFSWYD